MKKNVVLLIVFYFIQGIIHNLGHPVTPAFVRGLEIQDYMFGVFFASMSLGLMIGGPLWGILSDRGKKKGYLLIGLSLYSIGQFFFGYSNHPVLMVIFRFISGFGVASSLTLFSSQMIEISELKHRAKHFAYTAAALTLGASLGYWIGGFISTNELMRTLLQTEDLRRVFLYQALMNTVYTVVVLVILEETNKERIVHRPNVLEGLKSITKIEPKLFFFLISLTFITMGSVNLSKYIDVYFNELGYNPQELGTFVMATGIVALLTSVLIVPFFAKLKKQLNAIALIQLGSAIIVFYVFRANRFIIAIYTVYMIYVVFRTIYVPLEQNYISTYATEGKYGSIMGLRQSFVSIGMLIGPLVGGFLYEIRPLLLFDFSVVLFLVGLVLLLWIRWNERLEEKREAQKNFV